MAKIGKYAQNRVSTGSKVIASGQANKGKLSESLVKLGGILLAQAEFFIAWILAKLQAANDQLEAAEIALSAEKADDNPVRLKYGQATRDAIKYVIRVRAAVLGALGEDALPTYGLEGSTPRTGIPLRAYLANVANLLGEHPAVVEDELSKFDTAVVQTGVQAKHDALDGAIKQINKEERELQAALIARDKTLDHWADIYQGVANILEGLYRLVGFKELADQVRPTVRRLSGADDSGDLDEVPAEVPADGPSEEE